MSKLFRDLMRTKVRRLQLAEVSPAQQPTPSPEAAEVTRTVTLAADERQFVIGHEGRTLKKLLSLCGVRVAVPVGSPVTVTGSSRGVEVAVRNIHKLVRRAKTTPPSRWSAV